MAKTDKSASKSTLPADPTQVLRPGDDGYVPATAESYGNAKIPGVAQLSGDAEVAARTGPDAKADGKFRRVFTLSPRDYDEQADNDDMHRANEVATLQEALNKGVHAQGEAYLESAYRRADGSYDLTYAVEAIPASEDEQPADTQTPSKAIKEMGGSTIEDAQNSERFGTQGASATQ